MLKLRPIRLEDAPLIEAGFKAQGWGKPAEKYHHYHHLQTTGARDIILAEYEGIFAGYLTIRWASAYAPFLEKGIPEIVDFNVLKKFQRRGFGTALMDEAEARIQKVSQFAGIGFGMTPDYGPAQILYARRAYIPDGKGLSYDGKILTYGDQAPVDDSLVFHLIKQLY